jgi:hypothetical protein
MVNNKTTYAVIDLSAWPDGALPTANLHTLLTSVPHCDRAAVIVPSYVVSHAARYRKKCNVLINLSQHSGLYGAWKVSPRNDGYELDARLPLCYESWGDYVEFDEQLAYRWVFPRPAYLTSGRGDDFTEVPFHWIPQPSVRSWQFLRAVHGEPPNFGIDPGSLVAVALVLSPEDCSNQGIEFFRKMASSMELIDILPDDLEATLAEAQQQVAERICRANEIAEPEQSQVFKADA